MVLSSADYLPDNLLSDRPETKVTLLFCAFVHVLDGSPVIFSNQFGMIYTHILHKTPHHIRQTLCIAQVNGKSLPQWTAVTHRKLLHSNTSPATKVDARRFYYL